MGATIHSVSRRLMVGVARGPNVIPMCGRFVTMISDSLFVFEPIGLRFEQIIEYYKGIVQFIVKLPPKAAKKKNVN